MTKTTRDTTGATAKPRRAFYTRTADGRRVLVPGTPTRADRVVSWLGWHFFELTGVLVPAALAVVVTPWLWLLSAAVGVAWLVHERRSAREWAALRGERALPAATGTDRAADTPDSEVTG